MIISTLTQSCTDESKNDDPPVEIPDIQFVSVLTDVTIPQGGTASDYGSVTLVSIEDTIILTAIAYDISGLPSGVTATLEAREFGSNGAGAVVDAFVPCDLLMNYTVGQSATPGSYQITLTVAPYDADDQSQDPEFGTEIQTTFTLTVTEASSSSCNQNLAGNYAGPATCAPQGWGDTHVDVTTTSNSNVVDIYVEFFDPGSTMEATLDCGGGSFTIAQQICTVGGGAQQINVDGSGTFVFSQGDTTIVLVYNSQLVGSSDPPVPCQVDLTKQ